MIVSHSVSIRLVPQTPPSLISADEIDLDSSAPVAFQIADAYRRLIVAGRLRTGDPLPGARTLADHIGRDKNTVNAAYRLLAGWGRLVYRPGMAPVAREIPPSRTLDARRYADELARAKAGMIDRDQTNFCSAHRCTWHEYTVDAKFRTMPATAWHAEALGIPRGTPVLRREFIENVRDVPVQIRLSVLPADLVKGTPVARIASHPWPGGTVAELWSLGLEVDEVPEELETRSASPAEVTSLAVPEGHQLHVITRSFITVDQRESGRPAEASQLIMSAAGTKIRWTTKIRG